MKIPKNTLNSAIEYCIDQYVRLYRDREILRDRWFRGLSIKEIADKHHLSDTYVKQIFRDIGDEVLFRAAGIKNPPI